MRASTTDAGNAPAAPDDFVPSPDAPAPATVAAPTVQVVVPDRVEIGQTAMILGIVAVLVVAGLLLLVRNIVRRSLIAKRATLASATAAGWTWYLALLAIFIMIVAGIVAHLFDSMTYIVVTGFVAVVGLAAAYSTSARAERTA